MLYVVGAYMFVGRGARTARIPFDEIDPETSWSICSRHHGQPSVSNLAAFSSRYSTATERNDDQSSSFTE
jgi:hypothetical protein